jgi:hypothetical protein
MDKNIPYKFVYVALKKYIKEKLKIHLGWENWTSL